MSINPIQSRASFLPDLRLPGHGHKQGIHGDTQPQAAVSTSKIGQEPAGSAHSLFGSLMDAVEQLIGVKPAAAAGAAVTAATSTRTAPKV